MTQPPDPLTNGPAQTNGPIGQRTPPAIEEPAAVAAAAERAGVMFEQASDLAQQAAERAAAVSGRVATEVVDRLRNDAEYAVDRGSTRIEDEVVEKIAGIAAREVPGVHDLGGDTARFFASMKERVGLGEADKSNRGVSARLEGTTARITVTLVVDYGTRVRPVTEKVRAKVIEAVEGMLDLQVSEVNVVVDDVAAPEH